MADPSQSNVLRSVLASGFLLSACGDGGNNNPFDSGTSSASATSGQTSASSSGPSTSAGPSTGSASDSATTTATGATTDVKFDVGSGDDIPAGCKPGDDDCKGCTAVDILFVVDNSGSMTQHKPAVVAAFDPFVEQMVAALPPSTSLHVGVTRGTGFYDPGNSSSISNCEGTVDGSYYPPEMGNNMTNGQQGRLFEQAGQRFFEYETGQDSGALKTWFEATLAGAIASDQHSNTETVVAGAAYPFHPVNGTFNAGFMREQAVLVLFLLSDAPDLSPQAVPTQDFIDMVSDAKAACGDKCIITTGAVSQGCYDQMGITNTRLYDFMNGFGAAPPAYVELGWNGTPDFATVLGTALSEVIATTCDDIPPQG